MYVVLRGKRRHRVIYKTSWTARENAYWNTLHVSPLQISVLAFTYNCICDSQCLQEITWLSSSTLTSNL